MKKIEIGIIGLGYVGLPLAVEFAKKYRVIGYDVNEERVSKLNKFQDDTREISQNILKQVVYKKNIIKENSDGLLITSDELKLAECNIYIITVPTPIDKNKQPDLNPLISATNLVGSLLKRNNFVIYESTVFPGATEEICLPILEKLSSLKINNEFYLGYSPERINPGDKNNTLTKIIKVTSGSNDYAAKFIDNLYSSIITAGTFLASSIKVAEAAKVIENTQRDINIAFINELSKIFNLMEIDTNSVLQAAGTKWNFLDFKPGLVGGHCIGVDPYYLAQKALSIGYNPEIILSGRRINDSMGEFVAEKFIKLLINNNILIKNSKILILGITFKENCPDIRNSGVKSVIDKLLNYGVDISVYDPLASSQEVKSNYKIELIEKPVNNNYDGIMIAVAHKEFYKLDIDILKKNKQSIVFDVKGIKNNSDYKL